MDESYDVVVVGGGAAGLSGAVALARSRRSVLVIDAGDPRNAPAGHVHNFLTRDGTPPAEIYAAGRGEVARYGGRVETGRVTGAAPGRRAVPWSDRRRPGGDRPAAAGRHRPARRASRRAGPRRPVGHRRAALPVLPRLGGRATSASASSRPGPTAVHQALLFRQLSAHVTLLQHTGPAPTGEQREQLDARGIAVVEGDGRAGRGRCPRPDRRPAGRRPPGGARRGRRRAAHYRPRRAARPARPRAGRGADRRARGREPASRPTATGATAVPGVWVAGNVADLQAQVIIAAAAGLAAGAAINLDLVGEEARNAADTSGNIAVRGRSTVVLGHNG